MPESIRIAAYFPAHPSAKDASKTVPPKFRDGNDREFTIDKGLVEFVAAHQGQTIEAEWEETQNGKWTNRKLTGATIPTAPLAVEKPQGNGWRRDPEEGKLIVRQSCLKAAVDWLTLPDSRPEYGADPEAFLLKTADRFVAWVYGKVGPEHALTGPTPSPEQRAAKEALATGGSYSAALAGQKPHVATTLKANQSLGAAVAEVLANHDPLADEERPPHPADQIQRTLRAGAPQR